MYASLLCILLFYLSYTLWRSACIVSAYVTSCFLRFVFMIIFRSYSYYIEVSIDQKDWTRIIDHTNYYCRSWQYLFFDQRVVRYIRIVGTNNTVNKVFHLVSFEIMYTNTPFVLENGLVGKFYCCFNLKNGKMCVCVRAHAQKRSSLFFSCLVNMLLS